MVIEALKLLGATLEFAGWGQRAKRLQRFRDFLGFGGFGFNLCSPQLLHFNKCRVMIWQGGGGARRTINSTRAVEPQISELDKQELQVTRPLGV